MHRHILLFPLLAACGGDGADSRPVAISNDRAQSKLLFNEAPARWFEGYGASARISPDGRLAWYGGWGIDSRVIDLGSGEKARDGLWKGVDSVRNAAFRPDGELVLLGRRGTKPGWYARGKEDSGPEFLPLPPDAVPQWSPDAARYAYLQNEGPEPGIRAGPPGSERVYPTDGQVTGMSWLPDGRALLVMLADTSGTSSLVRLDLADARTEVIVRGLDADPTFSPVAVVPDGRRAYVALAAEGAPALEARSRPDAERDLDIYEVSLEGGGRRVVVDTPGDDFAPAVADGHLYWTTATLDASVVVLPVGGGAAREVVPGGQVPTWRPDGRQIGFFYGQWRLADWALNWDAGIIGTDSAGKPTSAPQELISWFGEDFPPVWSPDGRWIAYHSHRSTAAVPSYGAPGSADDIFLRRTGSPPSQDLRLTDFGREAGSPDWSPDGTRLVFTSWEKRGKPEGSFPWSVSIDRRTGRVVESGRLPLPPEIHGAEQVAWSPTGAELAIEEKITGGRHRLWVIPADGSRARKVVDYLMPTYGGVDWTPDGRLLIYSAVTGARMQLFAVPAAGGAPRRLSDDAANLLHPQVSPDGRLVAATRVLQHKEIRRIRLPT